MKKYPKEFIILIIQLFLFYIYPLFATSAGPIGMVFIILLVTSLLSIILAIISNHKKIYLYPIVISIIFIPSVYIYYNESALVHAIWYLMDSSIGILFGTIIKKIINKIKN